MKTDPGTQVLSKLTPESRTGPRVTLGRLCTQKESSQTNEATASKVGDNFSFI